MKIGNIDLLEFLEITENSFVFLDKYSHKYSKIYSLKESAVKKFGKDVKSFKETLSKYKPKNYKESIKKNICSTCAYDLEYFNRDFDILDYIECLIAILQVDFECPGFLQNFPEFKDQFIAIKKDKVYLIEQEYKNFYDNIIKNFNRYSKKSDFSYVKKLFEIPEKEDKLRLDDYISVNFSKFWKSDNEEIKTYLKLYYISSDILLPKDYAFLVKSSSFDKKIISSIKLNEDDLRWVDIYFKFQDRIVKHIHDNIEYKTPDYMKMINLTLT